MNITPTKIKELKTLLSQCQSLRDTILEVLSNESVPPHGRYSSFSDMAYYYNGFAKKFAEYNEISTFIPTFDLEKIPSFGDSVWPAQKRIMEQVLVNVRMLISSIESNLDFVNVEFDNIENFLQQRLRSCIFKKPEHEKEVQNALESLLLGRGYTKGVVYDRESGKVEFSGKEYIPDFIIKKMSLCIETKLLREGKKSQIIEEICADITAYSKVYNKQLYVVYDLGVIQNEVEFKNDINTIDGVKVIIIKH